MSTLCLYVNGIKMQNNTPMCIVDSYDEIGVGFFGYYLQHGYNQKHYVVACKVVNQSSRVSWKQQEVQSSLWRFRVASSRVSSHKATHDPPQRTSLPYHMQTRTGIRVGFMPVMHLQRYLRMSNMFFRAQNGSRHHCTHNIVLSTLLHLHISSCLWLLYYVTC